ncbi:Hypothetical protein SMAX5B_018663 [Scophthalmus maximus]|uniref:Uncharacterized protein n=1 Tax=Scophthalmus maximus TaxID=52904 RepID=A0A2U9C8D3_SCOMX|nr:Hypothetical protein SMAX5B_018663 [Scophthalmus maximus]
MPAVLDGEGADNPSASLPHQQLHIKSALSSFQSLVGHLQKVTKEFCVVGEQGDSFSRAEAASLRERTVRAGSEQGEQTHGKQRRAP